MTSIEGKPSKKNAKAALGMTEQKQREELEESKGADSQESDEEEMPHTLNACE